jgi:hypothetical protein
MGHMFAVLRTHMAEYRFQEFILQHFGVKNSGKLFKGRLPARPGVKTWYLFHAIIT